MRGADKFATLRIVNINRWLKRIAFRSQPGFARGYCARTCAAALTQGIAQGVLHRGLTQDGSGKRRRAQLSRTRAQRVILAASDATATRAANRDPLALINAK